MTDADKIEQLTRRVAALEAALQRTPACRTCNGSGKQPGLHNRCGRCLGTGTER